MTRAVPGIPEPKAATEIPRVPSTANVPLSVNPPQGRRAGWSEA